ncbi:MAG TPA: cytochrome C oxidase subunit IV family protein [Edaphocola sp.]|nr:cytochrome C oxidase subunit IV family protein [Edaphocola sp.]
MNRTINKSYIALILLTVIGVSMSNLPQSISITGLIIMMAVIKFIIVGFQFMELKKANSFWKALLIIYGILIGSIYFILLK